MLYYIPTQNIYLGKYNIFTPEELRYYETIEQKWKINIITNRPRAYDMLADSWFPAAKSYLKTSLQESRSALFALQDEEQRWIRILAKIQTHARWFWELIIDKVFIKPRQTPLQKQIKKALVLLSFTKKPEQNPSRITMLDLQKAKEFPITDLYAGQRIIKNGNRHQALCEFHEDRLPSLTIYADQNRWWCHAEAMGGDAVDYLMRQRNLSFREAIKFLNQ